MSKHENQEWLTKLSKDEIFSLNITSWKTESVTAEEFFNYIRPHAKYYFSAFSNLFLFTLKDLGALNYFDKILVRDGLLTLKLFFHRNPSPGSLKTKLLIHHRFSPFIPLDWEKNVHFFQYKFHGERKSKNKTLIISYHPDSFHTPLDEFEKSLKSFEEYEEILCLATNPKITDPNDFVVKDIFHKSAAICSKIKIPVRPITLDELSPRDMARADFLEINPYHYLVSDCFIRWHLLSHGAYPIDTEWLTKDENSTPIANLQLSPFHGLEILPKKALSPMPLEMNERLVFFRDITDVSELPPINLCSEGFKRYVFGLAKNAKNSCSNP